MIKLESFRKSRGMSRTELSDRSGVPVSVIASLEKELREATLSTWNALAKALKVPVSQLCMNQPGNGLVPRERLRSRG